MKQILRFVAVSLVGISLHAVAQCHSGWPSKRVYDAAFAQWPKLVEKHGQAVPESDGYAIAAYGSVWSGQGKGLRVGPLPGDFVFTVQFRVTQGDKWSFNVTLSDAGKDYSRLDFYLSSWSRDSTTYSIYESWVEDDFYVRTKRRIAERRETGERFLGRNWGESNLFQVRRQGGTMELYVNGILLYSFKVSSFPIRQFSLGVAFKSRVLVTSVTADVPEAPAQKEVYLEESEKLLYRGG